VRGSGLFVGEDLLAPLADPDFAFDDDGNILVDVAKPVTPKVSGRAAVQSDVETNVSVRQEPEEEQTGDVEVSMPANACWYSHLRSSLRFACPFTIISLCSTSSICTI
jgi:hypothetical protein